VRNFAEEFIYSMMCNKMIQRKCVYFKPGWSLLRLTSITLLAVE